MAFNAYLEICQQVDQQINAALKYDSCISHLKWSCPCCFYKLESEPKLEFWSFVSIDGNNSLKHLDTSVRNSNNCLNSHTVISTFQYPALFDSIICLTCHLIMHTKYKLPLI
jgi:hypothetical protein